jgi:4-hydroxy-tetrahydrodipicolinate reductase
MGKAAVTAISEHPNLTLVAATDRGDNLSLAMAHHKPEVVVDFTIASCGLANALEIVAAGVHPVIGTSGFQESEVEIVRKAALSRATSLNRDVVGGIIVPNFALGAVLLMKALGSFAKYYERAEIIELHHDQKEDAPSGTALRSAEVINSVSFDGVTRRRNPERELVEKVRGGNLGRVTLHSVRLPGYMASQEVIFGSLGERVSLRHDSISVESFMPGVCLSCERVVHLKEIFFGLEELL